MLKYTYEKRNLNLYKMKTNYIKKKRKGFTLVELLVTIACSTIIFMTISASMLFVSKMNKNLLSKSSNLYKLNVLKSYILNNYTTDASIEVDNGDVYFVQTTGDYSKKIIVTNTSITSVTINEENFINNVESTNYYIVCRINYDESNTKNKEYKFIISSKE